VAPDAGSSQLRFDFLDALTLLTTKTDIVPPRDVLRKRLDAEMSTASGPDSQHCGTHSLSQRLRAATMELHHQAETLLSIPSLISDRSSYAETLQRFYGVYAPLERALGSAVGINLASI